MKLKAVLAGRLDLFSVLTNPGTAIKAAIALRLANIPPSFWLVCDQTASVKNELFVEAAQAMGTSTWRVLTRSLFLHMVQRDNATTFHSLRDADDFWAGNWFEAALA